MVILRLIDGYGGCQASGANYEIAFNEAGDWRLLSGGTTDGAGRANLVSTEEDLRPGYYELTLFLGEYFRQAGYALPGRKFVDIVPIRFGLDAMGATAEITVTVGPNGYSVARAIDVVAA